MVGAENNHILITGVQGVTTATISPLNLGQPPARVTKVSTCYTNQYFAPTRIFWTFCATELFHFRRSRRRVARKCPVKRLMNTNIFLGPGKVNKLSPNFKST